MKFALAKVRVVFHLPIIYGGYQKSSVIGRFTIPFLCKFGLVSSVSYSFLNGAGESSKGRELAAYTTDGIRTRDFSIFEIDDLIKLVEDIGFALVC